MRPFSARTTSSPTCTWCTGSPVLRKTGEPVPNEDALVIAEDGARALLAIADGHFGHAASHTVIERLDLALEARANDARLAGADVLPRDLDDLYALVAGCADPTARASRRGTAAGPAASESETNAAPDPADWPERRSATTLVVAVVDRPAREVWGVSLGDSSAMAVGLHTGARWLTRATHIYASPADAASLAAARVSVFRAPVTPGEFVVVFSDGVNECEYRSPETSIGIRHIESLSLRARGNPEHFVDLLAQLALAGVDGHPGGEDNVALAAALV